MKISAAIIVTATLALATPMKREAGGVLICTGPKATGKCSYKVYPLDSTCQQLPKPFFENANTFATDGEAFECFPRAGSCDDICTSPTGCTFGAVDFGYEHKFNLSAIGWDKLFGSFDCTKKS